VGFSTESAVFKLLLLSALIGTWAFTGKVIRMRRMKNTGSNHLGIIKSVSLSSEYKPEVRTSHYQRKK
jgi:hypothetical protein